MIYKGPRFNTEGLFDFRSYTKPTNTHQYLHRSSFHDPTVFAVFIKGETIRHIKNNNNYETLVKILNEFKTHLLRRGYKASEIEANFNTALQKDRKELLRNAQKHDKGKNPFGVCYKIPSCN